MSKFRKGVGLVVLVALVALAAAVSAFGKSAATTTVAVTAGKPSELKFTLSKKTILKGTGVFKVTNRGSLPHNFKIAGKKTVNLGPGKTATLKVAFAKAGKYAYLCTVPGHAAGGMKGVLVVK
ncbi:MAG TPA: plastocyanin/azurin family copper-binding protein [Gaiellaceae bacterium]|nr:plastocyanin/azurin family copper-binding protein [Gaiellaceae bacterium]